MNVLLIVVAAFAGGLVGGMLVDARFWWSFVKEVYYHGPDNHFCKRAGCCR